MDLRGPRHETPEQLTPACSVYGLGVIYLTVLLAGCASTRVEYFVDPPYPAQAASHQVEWLSAEPSRPHIDLARITMGSANLSEESLRLKIVDRARTLGADAVVTEGNASVASLPNPPYYERSLLGPMGGAFGLYGYGWYTPYTSNPYLLTQGAVDIPRVDRYLTVVAIRYKPEEDSTPAP